MTHVRSCGAGKGISREASALLTRGSSPVGSSAYSRRKSHENTVMSWACGVDLVMQLPARCFAAACRRLTLAPYHLGWGGGGAPRTIWNHNFV